MLDLYTKIISNKELLLVIGATLLLINVNADMPALRLLSELALQFLGASQVFGLWLKRSK